MRFSTLERKLALGVVLLFLVPTLLAGAILLALYLRGVYEDNPAALLATAGIGLATMMAYLAAVGYAIGRSLVRTLQEIQLGTELMATVNPEHRLHVATGDELQSLAEEINRMADRVGDARSGLERQVARATSELRTEREKLSTVLAALGEGVVLTTPEGRVSLANRAAQQLLGASLLGRSLFDFVDREKLALFMERLGDGQDRVERFTLHPAGAVLETAMTPFFDGERRPSGFVLVFRDVTLPARSEDERRRALVDVLRELRGPLASVRSLSESLASDPTLVGESTRPLVQAIHAEAVRLSALVKDVGEPGHLALAPPPWPLEWIAAQDLTSMALRRLKAEGRDADAVDLGADASALPPLRAEVSALSSALARLLGAVLAHGEPGVPVWLRPTLRGNVLQLDIGADGMASAAELEPLLDTLPVDGPEPATVREVVQRHAGEAWAYADGGRLGYRVTLPVHAGPRGEEHARAAAGGRGRPGAAPTFVGMGMVSAWQAGESAAPRPELYDFSLFQEMEEGVRPGDLNRRLGDLTCVVLDVETTGLEPELGDRVLSLAGVKVRAGAVKRGGTFDALVNPGRPVPAASTRFHGITDALVAAAPPIDTVLPAFLRFAEGAVLAGHQVSFDLRFLGLEARRASLAPLTAGHAVLDTALLSEVVHGSLPEHGLEAVARRLGVAIRGRHSALGDAVATAEILVRLFELLERRGVRTLGEVLEASRRVRRGRLANLAAELRE